MAIFPLQFLIIYMENSSRRSIIVPRSMTKGVPMPKLKQTLVATSIIALGGLTVTDAHALFDDVRIPRNANRSLDLSPINLDPVKIKPFRLNHNIRIKGQTLNTIVPGVLGVTQSLTSGLFGVTQSALSGIASARQARLQKPDREKVLIPTLGQVTTGLFNGFGQTTSSLFGALGSIAQGAFTEGGLGTQAGVALANTVSAQMAARQAEQQAAEAQAGQ
jgi:hypothetical protein